MAQLIITDEERATASYLDWDDAALGAFTKQVALLLTKRDDDETDLQRVTAASVAVLLANQAAECNAGELTVTLTGVTRDGAQRGDWVITVKRKNRRKRTR